MSEEGNEGYLPDEAKLIVRASERLRLRKLEASMRPKWRRLSWWISIFDHLVIREE